MLEQYKFRIVYILGKENSRADALSRRLDIVGTKEIINTIILRINKDRSLGLARTLNILLNIGNNVLEEL